MELSTYLAIFWRRKWIILITFSMAMIVALVSILNIKTKYVVSATLQVAKDAGGEVTYGDELYFERLLNTHSEIATSRSTQQILQQHLGISKTLNVKISFPANTDLIDLGIEDTDPELATRAANTLATILVERNKKTRVGRTYSLALIEPADIQDVSASSPKKMILIVSVLVGIAGGVGLAFLFENLDTTLHTSALIEHISGLPTLGSIPIIRKAKESLLAQESSVEADAFRLLRTNILALRRDMNLRSLVITSAEPTEGTSTIVANLALVFAQSKRKVIVVDGNFHAPILHNVFALPNDTGLSNLLQKEVTIDKALQKGTIPELSIITSGTPPSHAPDLFDTPYTKVLIDQLVEQSDIVIIDSPALGAVSDTTILAPMVEGVLLVIARSLARKESVRSAILQLTAVKATTIGIVINRATKDRIQGHYQSHQKWIRNKLRIPKVNRNR